MCSLSKFALIKINNSAISFVFLVTLFLLPGHTQVDSLQTVKESQSEKTTVFVCDQLDTLSRIECLDSIQKAVSVNQQLLPSDSLASSAPEDREYSVKTDRTMTYVAAFVHDVGNKGDRKFSDWGEWVYVAVVVVVVGGAIIFLPKVIYDLSVNKNDVPVSQEVKGAYTYSGSNWEGGGGDLYRGTHMTDLQYTVFLASPKVGLGLTINSGYIVTRLEDIARPDQGYQFSGAFFLLGPQLRIGTRSDWALTFDYLNGTSTAKQIGWISKAQMGLQYKFPSKLVLGLTLGSLFYDLNFFDGLVWRRGSLNRDMTLQIGSSLGWSW